jgi:acyl transferase domain-containing protein
MTPHLVGALRATYNALEDAGIRLQDVHKTAVGIFVAGQVSFLPSPDAPDETTLRANIGSSIADGVSIKSFPSLAVAYEATK